MKPYIQTIAAAGCAALIALSSCSHNNQWEVTGVIADAEKRTPRPRRNGSQTATGT